MERIEALLAEKAALLAAANGLADRLKEVLGRVADVEAATTAATGEKGKSKSLERAPEPAPAPAPAPAANANAVATWLAATTLAQFTALSPEVNPSLLGHADLIAQGIVRCTDRKAILRKASKASAPAPAPADAPADVAAAPAAAEGGADANSGSSVPTAAPAGDGGPLPATIQEYFKDTYMFDGHGTVLAVGPGGEEGLFKVILDQTVFHPQGGGQPTDVGTMTVGNSTFTVEHVAMRSRECGIIEHTGKFTAGSAFAVGAAASLAVDAENRKLCARIHSAGHLLDAAMQATGRTDLEPSKGYHFSSGAYVEYIGKVEAADREPLAELLNKEINALIAGATDVEVKLPDAEGKTPRVVTMGGVSCPCGGTHVKNVSEIKGVTITKIKKAKKAVRVSYTIA